MFWLQKENRPSVLYWTHTWDKTLSEKSDKTVKIFLKILLLLNWCKWHASAPAKVGS